MLVDVEVGCLPEFPLDFFAPDMERTTTSVRMEQVQLRATPVVVSGVEYIEVYPYCSDVRHLSSDALSLVLKAAKQTRKNLKQTRCATHCIELNGGRNYLYVDNEREDAFLLVKVWDKYGLAILDTDLVWVE
jgi:hypothetical protein